MIEIKESKKVYNSYKKHHHDSLVISMLDKGKVKIIFDDKELILRPNSLVVFNPYENHKTVVLDADSEGYRTIYFDLSLCLTIQQSENFIPISQSIIRDNALQKAFLLLHKSEVIQKAEHFLARLFEEYCDKTTVHDRTTNEIIGKIGLLINNHCTNELSLQYLSKEVNISQNHLIRIFKKEFGLSPHAYILNHRVHKAKRYLEQNFSIAEASQKAGFYDQSHFHKAFKSLFAMTPKEFQKR